MLTSRHPRTTAAAILAAVMLAGCKSEQPKTSSDSIAPAPAPAAAPVEAPAAGAAAVAAATPNPAPPPAPASKSGMKAAAAGAGAAAASNAAPPSAPAPAPASAAMAAPPPGAAPASAGLKPASLTVRARNDSVMAPSTVTAGLTTITLANAGPGISHIQLLKLEPGKTAGDLQMAMKQNQKMPRWAFFASGPDAAMPGTRTSATVDLPAGNYVIVSMKVFPEHAPYIETGMLRALTVTPTSAAQPTMPTPDLTITANEYSLALSGPVTAGTHTFQVHMAGQEAHEVVLFKLGMGKSFGDFKTWMEGFEGPGPAIVVGGVAGTEPGLDVQFTSTINSGTYVLGSFLVHGADKQLDARRGMLITFTVP